MSILDALGNEDETVGKTYGVVAGIVTNNKDPDKLGKLKVKFLWFSDNHETDWIRMTTFMAGGERGSFFLPDVGDEVLVAFENGNIDRPYVIGALWNGIDQPPEKNSDGKNNIKMIKTRSGHTIKIDDTEGKEKIEIIDKTEENKISIDSANNKISIECGGDIELTASKGKIVINANEIDIIGSKVVNIN